MGAPARMTAPRLVLDSNVVLSALVFPDGSLSWLRHRWQAGEVVPLAGRDTTLELIRVLTYPKFGLTPVEQEDLLADYLPWCETVVVSKKPSVPHCRDPFGRPFLELALAARADALVSGDADLLALAPAFSVPIITPKALRDQLDVR